MTNRITSTSCSWRAAGIAGLALLLVAATAGPAAAAGPSISPLWAGYWGRFVDFWTGGLREQSGVVLFVIGTGLLSLFIITRGKWIK